MDLCETKEWVGHHQSLMYTQPKANGIGKTNTDSKQVSTSLKNTVFIMAYHRTGSSFTGAVLRSYPGAFYVFEPLLALNRFYEQKKTVTFFNGSRAFVTRSVLDYLIKQDLRAWATCKLDKLPIERFSEPHPLSGNNSLDPFVKCSQKNNTTGFFMCLRDLESACRSASLRVLKFIRIRGPELEELLASFPNLKFIYLVRDPRGNALSQKGKIKGNIEQIAGDYCTALRTESRLNEELSKKFPDRIYTIKYEQLAMFPLEYAEKMLQFVSKSLHVKKQMATYIQTIAINGTQQACRYCVERGNGSQSATNWRNKINRETLNKVNRLCADVISRFGYSKFSNLSEVRNIEIPSIV